MRALDADELSLACLNADRTELEPSDVTAQEEQSGKLEKVAQPARVGELAKTWPILLVGATMQLFNMLEANIFLPYLYTRVQCCISDEGKALPHLDSHYAITAPEKVALVKGAADALGLRVRFQDSTIPACAVPAFPSAHKLWSLSPSCTNRAFVEDEAQRTVALNTPLQKMAGLLVLPVGGALSDSWGRRPVLMLYASCCALACAVFTLDTRWHSTWGDLPVYAAGMLLCVSWEPKDAVLTGAIADLLGEGEADKSRTFALLAALSAVGTVAGFFIAYVCVRVHLESYTLPWLGFTLVSLCIMMLLYKAVPETLPKALRRPVTGEMLNPLHVHLRSLQHLARDRILVTMAAVVFLWYVHFIGFITTVFSYLCMIGFSMEEAVLPGAVGNIVQGVLAAFLMPLLPCIGIWNAFVIGNALFALAYLLWGPFTVLVGHVGPYVASIAQSFAFALWTPALQTIISQRAGSDNQGKCQGAISAVATVGAIVGTPLYSGVVFDGTAHGMDQARPALLSAALAMLAAVLATILAVMARAEQPANTRGHTPCSKAPTDGNGSRMLAPL
mmetsp:Transcript_116493/g.324646  ORF Transcript_116493/g.324646 Transcript_116493/m.324646 type:complete len:561 (+) Transcript_116493:52-1734(+)